VKGACGGRRGLFLQTFHETATAGGPAEYGNLATAVRVILPTPQNTSTALEGEVAEA